MTEALGTYLHDHLAGADLAIETLRRLQSEHLDPATQSLFASLLPEIEQDRETLRCFAETVRTPASPLKEAGSWLSEKALRFKLRAGGGDPFPTFETLEFLAMGTLGKSHLWRALESAAPREAAVAGLDLAELVRRAEAQYARLEERRCQLAPAALNPRT
jgi:hypothetical protein